MLRADLGNTGLNVSVLALGTGTTGGGIRRPRLDEGPSGW